MRRFLTTLTGVRARHRIAGRRLARQILPFLARLTLIEHYADTCRTSRRACGRLEGLQRQDEDEEAKEDACARVECGLASFLRSIYSFHDLTPHLSVPGCLLAIRTGIDCIDPAVSCLSRVHSSSYHATHDVVNSAHSIVPRLLLCPKPIVCPRSMIVTACCQLTNQLQPLPPLLSRTGYFIRPSHVGLPAKTCRWMCATLDAGEMWNPILRTAGTSSSARSFMS